MSKTKIEIELTQNTTNGDVIKAAFPNVRIIEMPEVGVIEVHDGLLGESRNFSWEWWYTPYKEVKADDKRRSDS